MKYGTTQHSERLNDLLHIESSGIWELKWTGFGHLQLYSVWSLPNPILQVFQFIASIINFIYFAASHLLYFPCSFPTIMGFSKENKNIKTKTNILCSVQFSQLVNLGSYSAEINPSISFPPPLNACMWHICMCTCVYENIHRKEKQPSYEINSKSFIYIISSEFNVWEITFNERKF